MKSETKKAFISFVVFLFLIIYFSVTRGFDEPTTIECDYHGIEAVGRMGDVRVGICENLETAVFEAIKLYANSTLFASFETREQIDSESVWLRKCLPIENTCCRGNLCWWKSNDELKITVNESEIEIVGQPAMFVFSVLTRNK